MLGHSSELANSSLDARLGPLICLALFLVTFAAYAQVVHFDFVQYDDPAYVSENAHVQAGLTPAGTRWAFTAAVVGNWMPLTLLSHMLDCQLFGLRSGMHHLVNVAFHAFAALLLFAALHRATRSPALAAFVAFVFAMHPLHVQSVAWVAERKDVLGAFFFFLALYCYVIYSESPSVARYLAVFATFCLGLMSKPMLVTFPFVLLLVDFWPLRRFSWPKIVWEKIPLFALSAASCIVTYAVQSSYGAVQSKPLGLRTGNALISSVTYLGQTLWPSGLAVFYPFPKSVAPWHVAGALILLLGVSAGALYQWRTRPYLATGWFWYLGMLVPVIGLVQVGDQAHADRYTYLPQVGLTLAMAWGAADLAAKWPRSKPVMAAAMVFCAALAMVVSWRQIGYWRNSEALFQHTIEVTGPNVIAECNLGGYLMKQPGRRQDAVEHLQAALRIDPTSTQAHNNLGICLLDAGLYNDAISHFEASLRLKPDAVQPLNNLGTCLLNTGNYEAALPYFAAALRARPDSAEIHLNLGMTLAKIPGRSPDAVNQYQEALRLRPDYAEAHYWLGVALVSLGRVDEAIAHLEAAERLRPSHDIAAIIENLRPAKP
jgi:tetratricopeptide (TPR) repeat protein